MIRGKIWGPCWLKIQWQGAAGGAVMGHCICVRERWWWVALKSDGPWSTDGVHCLTTTAVEHTAQCATPHTSQRSKLLASNHVEWRPIIVHYFSRLRKSIGAKHMPTRCSHTRVGSPAQCNLHTTYTWDDTRGERTQYTGSTVSILCKRPKWHRLHPWTCHPVHPAIETD